MPHVSTEQEQDDYFKKFEKYDESAVRIEVNKGTWRRTNRIMLSYAQEWLRLKDDERALAASSKRDAREEETLSIARKALSISEKANAIAQSQSAAAWRAARYAMYAAVISVISLIISNKDIITSYF